MVARRNAVVCLPGTLAHSELAHQPLWLERFFNTVVYHDYADRNFDAEYEKYCVCEVIRSLDHDGFDVTVLGSSLGGNLTAFVAEELKTSHDDLADWLKVVIVDAPFGLRTFKAVPAWISPGLVTSPVGTAIFGLIGGVTIAVNSMGMGLPKDEFITRPSPAVMKHMSSRNGFSNEEWRDWVKAEAKRGLSGHSGRVWRQQIQWMTRIEQDGSLERAARSLRGTNVTYLQCTLGNDVVIQPAASEWWSEQVGMANARWWNVKAPHCGYLQMQPQFDELFARLFS